LSFLKNEEIGKASILALPFSLFGRVQRLVKRIWRHAFINYALKRYEIYLKQHYSAEGVGYFNYDALSDDKCIAIFGEMESRLGYYIDHNPSVLNYEDGDRFLDAGCGRGQNIKELVCRYPHSTIKGFDVNKGALRVIQTALKDRTNAQVEVGSIVNPTYLGEYPAKSIDHVVVSHVFSFLIDRDIEETKKLRQATIDQLLRIAKKTVIILDANIWKDDEGVELVIEQNTRCFFKESLAPYFSPYLDRGELYLALSPEDRAFIFKAF
jgi:ubiquinone/menaquinone biosynthesis C-methylase UbiE